MNYFIARDGQQYGPYTLGDLQRYVASGDISIADLATSDGLPEPMPVGQIIGTIAAPPPAYYNASPVTLAPQYDDAPNLHWSLVLLFTFLTCGLFVAVWEIVQAVWLQRLEPQNKALYYYGAAGVGLIAIMGISFATSLNHANIFPGQQLIQIVVWVLTVTGRFNFRSGMEKHFNEAEPMGLDLNGAMVFFFGGIYFQYHINDINRRKAADRLYEMTR